MKISIGAIQKDGNADIYWFRVVCAKDDDSEISTKYFGATWEYLSDRYEQNSSHVFNTEDISRWQTEVMSENNESEEKVFSERFHYYTYANSEEAVLSCGSFLRGLQGNRG